MSVAEASAPAREYLYEGMFLVDSGQYANDPEGTTAEIMRILERAGATVVAHRPWQDGKLAYEIEGRRKGTHYIVCFRMPGTGMTTLNRQSQLSDIVLRQLVIRQPAVIFDAVVAAISGEPGGEEGEAAAE